MGTRKVHINITIDEELNDWLDEMAVEHRINKSQFINNIVSVTKSDVKIYKAIGLFDVARAGIRLKEECAKLGMKFKGISWKGTKKEVLKLPRRIGG